MVIFYYMWIFFIIVSVIFIALLLFTSKFQNNARVSCRWCGQWFNLYADVDDNRRNWYEPTGEDLQSKCICRFVIGR